MIFDYIKRINWSKGNIFAAACVLIAMVALYNWFAAPHVQYLMAAQRYETAANEVEKTSKITNAEIQTGQKKLDEISGQFRQKKQEFFGVESARSFLESIQSKVEKNRLFVDSLKFQPPKQITTYDGNSIDIWQYQVNLTVSGQYQDIVKFLDSLQNRKEKVWIDMISLHLKDQATGSLVCDLSLSIYTLKIKEIVNDVKTEK
ncbi:MAG: type 4a pilus biogenesis protein PilO [Phycisphaerae bacterium]|nr:type 4a pilus biogenesis protein PilO [Phycisphaerae bacterium]